MVIEIVDFPINNGGSFHSYVSLPEGRCFKNINGYSTDSIQHQWMDWVDQETGVYLTSNVFGSHESSTGYESKWSMPNRTCLPQKTTQIVFPCVSIYIYNIHIYIYIHTHTPCGGCNDGPKYPKRWALCPTVSPKKWLVLITLWLCQNSYWKWP